MVESTSGIVVWSIKKDDFYNGNFEEAKYELGNYVWSMLSNSKNPLQEDTVSFTLCCAFKGTSKYFLCNCGQASGIVCLKGVVEKLNVMTPWYLYSEVKLKVDNSLLSFDEKYLYSDGTYRIEFNVEQQCSIVDFECASHALILGPSDAGCLQIEETKLYVSKSYFSAQSPYFKALFFGDFKEKTQEVIVLNDVKIDTFIEFLIHLYAEFHFYYKKYFNRRIHAAIPEVLALADMFLCSTVTKSCETILAEKTSFTVADLELADKYRLYFLRTTCVPLLLIDDLKKYLKQISDVPELKHTRHYVLDRIERDACR